MAVNKIYLQLDPKKDITSEPDFFWKIHFGKIPFGKNKIQFEKKRFKNKYSQLDPKKTLPPTTMKASNHT